MLNVLTFQMLLVVSPAHDQLIVCVLCVFDEQFLNHSEVLHNAVYNHLKLWRLKDKKTCFITQGYIGVPDIRN